MAGVGGGKMTCIWFKKMTAVDRYTIFLTNYRLNFTCRLKKDKVGADRLEVVVTQII
jgi:hypothetical protein